MRSIVVLKLLNANGFWQISVGREVTRSKARLRLLKVQFNRCGSTVEMQNVLRKLKM